jgi:predicted DNA-binding transcriptional regulator AlpA
MTDPELMTVKDVATLTKIKPATLHLWYREGRGPRAMKLGKALRYRRQDVDAFMAAAMGEPPPSPMPPVATRMPWGILRGGQA